MIGKIRIIKQSQRPLRAVNEADQRFEPIGSLRNDGEMVAVDQPGALVLTGLGRCCGARLGFRRRRPTRSHFARRLVHSSAVAVGSKRGKAPVSLTFGASVTISPAFPNYQRIAER